MDDPDLQQAAKIPPATTTGGLLTLLNEARPAIFRGERPNGVVGFHIRTIQFGPIARNPLDLWQWVPTTPLRVIYIERRHVFFHACVMQA